MTDLALVFPPGWYYTAHPADLSLPAGYLRAAGLRVRTLDLNARLLGVWFGDSAAAATLRDPATYADPDRHLAASAAIAGRACAIAQAHGVRYTLRQLHLRDDPAVTRSWAAAREVGCGAHNPARTLLRNAAAELVASGVPAVAVAMVHPEQVPQAAGFVAALREAGFRGRVALYGVLEDAYSPLDFAPDLTGDPVHAVFADVDAVVVGESEAALAAFAAGDLDAPGLATRHHPAAPSPPLALGAHPGPSFDDLRPHTLVPAPVVDLRLGRGCPWGRCTFCAIARHTVDGYRAGPAAAVVSAMVRAHAASGAVFFRVRDDLLTSRQILDLSDAVDAAPFRPRWSCRTRLEVSFTEAVWRRARRSGLEEVWVGLESASERVRDLMDKGVSDDVVGRVLAGASAAGVRVRLLCLVGFPGETPAEAEATLDFVAAHAHLVAGLSLTPFQLARRAPIAADPPPGLRVLPDPVPREDRVAATLPCSVDGGVDTAALVRSAYDAVFPRLPAALGPDLHHDWIAASVRAAGWPSGA